MTATINRPFLKWAGGKAKLADRINELLPKARCLVEPFVGAGSIFLNTDFDHYVLCDINPDLINTFNQLKQHQSVFIADAQGLFVQANNTDAMFRQLKARFNSTSDQYEKALLFVYLNRFCFNGLCRYNKSGEFNVAFGKYKEPYFPCEEMMAFATRLERAELHCRGFERTFKHLPADSVVYCDPPYMPASDTANFTAYSADGFAILQQRYLAYLAKSCAVPVVISNSDTPQSRALYTGAEMHFFDVQRSISCSTDNRQKAQELLAVYSKNQQERAA